MKYTQNIVHGVVLLYIYGGVHFTMSRTQVHTACKYVSEVADLEVIVASLLFHSTITATNAIHYKDSG